MPFYTLDIDIVPLSRHSFKNVGQQVLAISIWSNIPSNFVHTTPGHNDQNYAVPDFSYYAPIWAVSP